MFCAVGVAWTAINVRHAYMRAKQPLSTAAARIADWQSYAQNGHRRGPKRASVTVVVLSDYQCNYCAVLEHQLAAMRREHPDALSVALLHYPLPGHGVAVAAARAAICADEQGRFDTMHEQLFAQGASLGKVSWDTLAGRAEVGDLTRYRACLADAQSAAKLQMHIELGQRLRASVTPTILINDEMYDGLPPDLDRLIARAIQARGKQVRE